MPPLFAIWTLPHVLWCLQDVTGLRLLVWFMNTEPDGSESTYPFLLTCPLPHWSPREIICEENYMEVCGLGMGGECPFYVGPPPPQKKTVKWLTKIA